MFTFYDKIASMKQKNNAIYTIATPKDKGQAAQLTGSNSICGNRFTLKVDSKNPVVTIKNKFDYAVAELSKEDSKIIKL